MWMSTRKGWKSVAFLFLQKLFCKKNYLILLGLRTDVAAFFLKSIAFHRCILYGLYRLLHSSCTILYQIQVTANGVHSICELCVADVHIYARKFKFFSCLKCSSNYWTNKKSSSQFVKHSYSLWWPHIASIHKFDDILRV